MSLTPGSQLPDGTTSSKEKIKIILLLAMPAVVENFFQMNVGFVDTLFVSQLGLIEVSAVGVTNAILAVYIAIFMSLGVAVNVYVAKYIGADQPEKANKITQQAILLASALGLLLGAVTLFFAGPLLQLMGIEEAVLGPAKVYFRIIAIPSIFMALMFAFSSILRGTGDTKTPMKVTIGINLVNIGLDYVLIFGFWFIPPLGIEGAAIASLTSRIIGSGLLFWYVYRSGKLTLKKQYWRVDRRQQWDLITLGSPVGAERLVMRVGQVLYFGFVVAIGTRTFAAHQIAGSIETFSYMIATGFATAATILTGQQWGANRYDEAKQYAKLSTLVGIVAMILFGAVLFFFGGWAGHFFTNDPDVIDQISTALKIGGLYQPILAIVLILTAAFNGGGNTKFPMYITTIGIWGIRTLFVYLLGLQLGWGIAGVWIAIALDNIFRAVFLWIWFQRGRWVKEKSEPART